MRLAFVRTWHVTALALLAPGGCGNSSTGAAVEVEAGTTERDAGIDAGVPADQDPNVFPAKHHPLPAVSNQGGPVLFESDVATITFALDPMRDDIWSFGGSLVISDWWNAVAVPYDLSPGTSPGAFELGDTVSGKTLDDVQDLQPYIQQQVTAGTLPKPTKRSLFVFYFPAATTVVNRHGERTCQDIGGYHESTVVTLDNRTTVPLAYAVIGRCSMSLDDLTYAASHEILEAAMDPAPSTLPALFMTGNEAWTGTTGGEVADVCGFAGPINFDGYALSHAWVNAAGSAGADPCQPTATGDVYFQAAMDSQQLQVTDAFGTYLSDGFVTVSRGATTRVTGTVYSQAALPTDVALDVGAAPTMVTDPKSLAPIEGGVTATLSRATAHNGQEIVLTISADANAAPGNHPFVVRSVLVIPPAQASSVSTRLAHAWPLILRVR